MSYVAERRHPSRLFSLKAMPRQDGLRFFFVRCFFFFATDNWFFFFEIHIIRFYFDVLLVDTFYSFFIVFVKTAA